MNVLLVSPQTPLTFWSLKHAVRFVARQAAFPPLGLLTVAAMLPKSWNLRVVDMDVTRLRDADLRWADYVMIGGMIVHNRSTRKSFRVASVSVERPSAADPCSRRVMKSTRERFTPCVASAKRSSRM